MNTQTWTRYLKEERSLLVQERIKEWREYYARMRHLKAAQKRRHVADPYDLPYIIIENEE